MIFEDLEIIWRDESSHPSHTIDDDVLRELVRERARQYRSGILWRDASDILVHAVVAVFLFGVCIWGFTREEGTTLAEAAPLLLIGTAYAFTAGFRLVGRHRQHQRESRFDDSVRGNLEKLVSNAGYQVRLHRGYFWWYLVPVVPGFILLAASHWSSGPAAFSFMTLCVCVIFGFVYWGNLQGLRGTHIPQLEELQGLLDGLENSGASAEIRKPSQAVPQVPLCRRMFGFALAAVIFGLGIWTFVKIIQPAAGLQDPAFDDVSAFADGDKKRIDEWLRKTVEQSDYPSLGVAVVKGGELVYQGVFGHENLWAKRPATTNTAYHVASVTKTFTATLAVLLHDRGVIDLDQPIAKWLPDDVRISTTPDRGATITCRQLATHTSGLPRRVPGKVQSVEWRYQLEPRRLYDLLADVELKSDPGTAEAYSNLGFGLLGHVLELAAGKPLNELLQEHLCQPLGLRHTAIHVDPDLPIATGYTTPPRLPERHSYKQRLAGSGGLVSSASDLAKFIAANLQAGVFTSNQLSRLHTPARLQDGSATDHGLAWSVRRTQRAGVVISKSGGRGNASAWIGFAPRHGIGVVVLANIGDPEVEPIGRWLLERSVPADAPRDPRGEHPMIAPFTGVRWENDLPVVRVNEKWYGLTAINGIPIAEIMESAREQFGNRARKRLAEDLPRLMAGMGRPTRRDVTLGLRDADGTVTTRTVRMTEAKRQRVRD